MGAVQPQSAVVQGPVSWAGGPREGLSSKDGAAVALMVSDEDRLQIVGKVRGPRAVQLPLRRAASRMQENEIGGLDTRG